MSLTKLRSVSEFAGACGIDIGGSLCKAVLICRKERIAEIRTTRPEWSVNSQFDMPVGSVLALLGRESESHADEFEGRFEVAFISLSSREESQLQVFLEFVKNAIRIARADAVASTLAEIADGSGLQFPVAITGGGSVKFGTLIRRVFGDGVSLVAEMDSLVDGMNAMLSLDGQYDPTISGSRPKTSENWLLVNAGSGVSMLKFSPACADKQNTEVHNQCDSSLWSARRIFGTPIGGGTLLGISRVLFPEMGDLELSDSYEKLIDLSAKGNSASLDMSVSDLWLSAETKQLVGHHAVDPVLAAWDPDTLAISFAKQLTVASDDIQLNLSRKKSRKEAESGIAGDCVEATAQSFVASPSRCRSPVSYSTSEADVAQSLVKMVSYNLGNLAYLVSTQNECSTIVFSGRFVNNHAPTMEAVTKAVRFYEAWHANEKIGNANEQSGGALGTPLPLNLVFLKHDGFVGSLGALSRLKGHV